MKTHDLSGFKVIQILKKAETKKEKGICLKAKSLKETFQNNLQMMVQMIVKKLNLPSDAKGRNARLVKGLKS